MSSLSQVNNKKNFITHLDEPPVARSLFGDVKWAWLWLILRIYIGRIWLEAGIGKLQNPTWTGSQAGKSLTGFITGALAKTEGAHPDVQGWYAWFLQNVIMPNAAFWSYVVAIGETLVGIALVLGIFTGIAAFFGVFMNANYLMAGTVSTNPIMLFIAIMLILAWRTAGWLGVDRWLLSALGTPWKPGKIFRNP